MKHLALLSLGLLLSCTVGPSARNSPYATGPAGADVTVRLTGERVAGELLEAGDSALLVLTSAGVIRTPYSAMREVHVALTERRFLSSPPPDDVLRTWRALSRFPGGIPEPALRALLAQHGQSEPRVWQ